MADSPNDAMPGSAPPLLSGVYRHYKADRCYLVLGLGHDANLDGRTVVVYVPLYVEATQPGPRLAVRTAEDFLAWVDRGSGATVDAGTPGAARRFTYMPEMTLPSAALPTTADDHA